MSSNAYVGITNHASKILCLGCDGDGGAIYQQSGTLIISSLPF